MHPLTHTTLVGNWATLLLATNKNGEIDYKRMGDEIDILIASSPCGIYSNGTAGEFYTQNEEEFIKTSELLADISKSITSCQVSKSWRSPSNLTRLVSGHIGRGCHFFAKDGRSGKRNSYRPLQSSSCKKDTFSP